jgi:hypothetical protein
LNRHKTIRPVLALVMLCLFGFSITPRKTLHELFACHPDTRREVQKPGGETLDRDSFHCSCDQPELQMPFIEYPVWVVLPIPATFNNERPFPHSARLYENTHDFSKLRGPPVTA